MSDWKNIFKGKTPVLYLRVSSQAQKQRGSGVVSQRKLIDDWLKANKITKKPVVFKDVGSGGNESAKRKEWSNMIDFLKEQKDPSKFFVVMRDYTRWSRHIFFGPEAAAYLYRNGVEIVSVNRDSSTGHELKGKVRLDPEGAFFFGLFTTLGHQQRTMGMQNVKGGTDTARQQLGVIGGQPLDIEGEFDILLQYEKDLRDEVVGYAAVGRDRMEWRSPRKRNPNTGKMGGNNPRGRSWMINSMDRFDRIRKLGENPQEWIDIVSQVKDVRDKFGIKSKEFLAVQRMTSGFTKKPSEFYEFKPTKEMIQNWIDNAEDFQQSKGR